MYPLTSLKGKPCILPQALKNKRRKKKTYPIPYTKGSP
jgi:hypothetical protein